MTPRHLLSAMLHPAVLAEWRRVWPFIVIVAVFLFGLAVVGPERW